MVILLIQSDEEPYGNNNIILVTHRPNGPNLGLPNTKETRILEGDRVTLSGESLALRTYESARGALPAAWAAAMP